VESIKLDIREMAGQNRDKKYVNSKTPRRAFLVVEINYFLAQFYLETWTHSRGETGLFN